MLNLVINQKTSMQIKSAEEATAHAYLFVGKKGLGKTLSAKLFAEKIIGPGASKGDKDRWSYFVEPLDGKKISIKQIREVSNYCSKTSPTSIDNKVVIIDRAENMSLEAFNSLLSLLEEPPVKTVIILVAHSKYNIPKTVLSRLHTINFYPPSNEQLNELILSQGLSQDVVEFAEMLPARLFEMSGRGDEIKNLINRIEDFARGSITERLMIVSTLTEKMEVKNFLDYMGTFLQSRCEIDGWFKKSQSLILAQVHLYNNGNTKLVMENLAMEF